MKVLKGQRHGKENFCGGLQWSYRKWVPGKPPVMEDCNLKAAEKIILSSVLQDCFVLP